MTIRQIENLFTYHPPTADQVRLYQSIRAGAMQFAAVLSANTPLCRESRLAMDRLREAVMWANAAVACHEGGPVSTSELE